ncbi:3-isopropylmalate dehydratase small subunit [Candidatus Bathyarchaeota archaeon]|nr:3-isopropylmalate dehydratase small subunit [Candidatus Bathyarchaeota archaeon]
MIITGNAVKVGDHINTDLILPGKYLVFIEPEELAKHALEGLDPKFPEKAKGGVILIAGKNFGCGSSREQAPIALKHANVKCIVADSFARIFYRNAINIGLPVVECKEIADKVNEGDQLAVDLAGGVIKDLTLNQSWQVKPVPKFLLEILTAGGLVEYLKKRIKSK